MEYLNKCSCVELQRNELKKIDGGIVWWIPIAIGIAYDEIDDIWESGGDNLRDAHKAGKEHAESIMS